MVSGRVRFHTTKPFIIYTIWTRLLQYRSVNIKTPPSRFEIFNSQTKCTIIYKKSWKVGRKVLLFTKNLSSEKPPKYPFWPFPPSEIALKSQFFRLRRFSALYTPYFFRRASRAISSIYPCKTDYCGPFLERKSSFFSACGRLSVLLFTKNPGKFAEKYYYLQKILESLAEKYYCRGG